MTPGLCKQHGKRTDSILLSTQLEVYTLQPLAQSDAGTDNADSDIIAFGSMAWTVSDQILVENGVSALAEPQH